jgi:hypothetical protein
MKKLNQYSQKNEASVSIKPKILIFEGAGWEKAEHNGVGNCRIRATFKNKNGQGVYIELIGHKPHTHSPESVKRYNFAGFVSHLFYTKDKKTNYTPALRRLERVTFEYTKENILTLVNSLEVGGDFTDIEVRNEGWNGFSINGLENQEES